MEPPPDTVDGMQEGGCSVVANKMLLHYRNHHHKEPVTHRSDGNPASRAN